MKLPAGSPAPLYVIFPVALGPGEDPHVTVMPGGPEGMSPETQGSTANAEEAEATAAVVRRMETYLFMVMV
jgi:hypothetical protein